MSQESDINTAEGFERAPSFSRRQWDLLDAALRLLDRNGLSEFTMRALADEVGLSPMAAYKHFDNQRALQLELWRECQNHLFDTLAAVADKQRDAASAFMAVASAFVDYAVTYPNRYAFLFSDPFVREAATVALIEDRRQEVWARLCGLVSDAQDARLFRDDQHAESLVVCTASLVRGLADNVLYARMLGLSDSAEQAMRESGIARLRDLLIAR
jgi:AcrR family transcriptional regulator